MNYKKDEKEKAPPTPLQIYLNKGKGTICTEFEKLCPTWRSFELMMKEVHVVFDDIEAYILEHYTER